jgi:phosphinothricin acetyltransferase
MEARIRHATATDLARINAIYNAYIVDRHTSFDTEPWTMREREAWFAKYSETGRYQLLVIEDDTGVMGFAASSPFRDKIGYNTSVETTIALDDSVVGQRLGSRLLSALLECLAHEDVHRAYSLIALPNDASIALHLRHDYREVGVLDEVGHKLGSFHSVLMMERRL